MENKRIKKSRFKPARRWLLFWCLFIGIGAVAGAFCMIFDPSGNAMSMAPMLPYFQVLPFADIFFQDFLFPGIALLCVNGITNLVSAVLILKNKRFGIETGALWGVTLMLWICIQFYIFPLNFMSTIYFFFGLFQLITGYACLVFRMQESFHFDKAEYKNIGTAADALVLYFSRMGYTEKAAYETANRLGADIEEVTTPEKTAGTYGFWWCGRFGMHGWAMKVAPLKKDVSEYDRVIICSPIWVLTPSAAIKGLCKMLSGKVRSVSYIFVHFNPWVPKNAAVKLDEIIGAKHETASDVRSFCGRLHWHITAEKLRGDIHK